VLEVRLVDEDRTRENTGATAVEAVDSVEALELVRDRAGAGAGEEVVFRSELGLLHACLAERCGSTVEINSGTSLSSGSGTQRYSGCCSRVFRGGSGLLEIKVLVVSRAKVLKSTLIRVLGKSSDSNVIERVAMLGIVGGNVV
jgi:hypothetical protein